MMVVLVAADADDVGHALKQLLHFEHEVLELLVIEVGAECQLRLHGDSPERETGRGLPKQRLLREDGQAVLLDVAVHELREAVAE